MSANTVRPCPRGSAPWPARACCWRRSRADCARAATVLPRRRRRASQVTAGLFQCRARPDVRVGRAVSRSPARPGADGVDLSGRRRRRGEVVEGAPRRKGRDCRVAGRLAALGSERAGPGRVPAGAGLARTGRGLGAAHGRCLPRAARARDGLRAATASPGRTGRQPQVERIPADQQGRLDQCRRR